MATPLSPKISLKRIQIEPTNRCNFRCVFCRRTHWRRKVGDLSLGQFGRILEGLPVTRHIHLQGQGEPLLNVDFPAMIQMARGQGITVGTTTNASLLTKDLASQILGAGINRINISLDTVDPHLFETLRSGPPLSLILQNINLLSKARTTGGYEVCLAVAVVALQQAIADLPKVIDVASDLGLDEVYVQNLNGSFLPQEGVKKESLLAAQNDRIADFFFAAHQIACAKGIKLFLPSLVPQVEHICQWPFNGCNITWDGYVSPCCLQPDPDTRNFGNVFREDFMAMWEGGAYSRFRAAAKSGTADICRTCPELTGQMWHPEAGPF